MAAPLMHLHRSLFFSIWLMILTAIIAALVANSYIFYASIKEDMDRVNGPEIEMGAMNVVNALADQKLADLTNPETVTIATRALSEHNLDHISIVRLAEQTALEVTRLQDGTILPNISRVGSAISHHCSGLYQAPIFGEKGHLDGLVSICASLQSNENFIFSILFKNFIISCLLAISLGAGIFFFLRNRLEIPIEEMSATLRNLDEHGIPKDTVASHDTAELKPLAREINKIITTARQSNTELEQSLHSLEASREALAESERKKDEIIWGTDVGTWEWNVQTGETLFNERWADIVGYTLDELAPISIETWLSLAHPDDLPRSGALLEKNFSKELDHYECEVRMRHKDGSWVWVLDRGKVVEWTKDGKPLRMAGTHADVTKRRSSELMLEDAIESLSEGFCFYDNQDRLVSCNKRYLELYKDSAPAIKPGNTFRAIIEYGVSKGQYADAIGREDAFIEERLALHLNPSKAIEQHLSDGRWLRIEERKTALGGTVGIRADVTALKMAEQRLRDAIEAIPDGFVLWDKNDQMVMCNETYRDLYPGMADLLKPGVSYQTVLDHALKNRVFDIHGDEQEWRQSMLSEHRNPSGIHTHQLSRGRTVLVSNRTCSNGDVVGVRTDITDIQKAMMRLEAYNEELKGFAYIASHDLREPLRMVSSYLQLLKKRYGAVLDEDGLSFIDYAVGGAKRMDALILDLLSYSRVEITGTNLCPLPSDKICSDAIKNLEIAIQSRNATVTMGAFPMVMADQNQLLQVFQNLIGNGLKYCPEERAPIIHLECHKEGTWICFSVTDNGLGIEERYFDKIFRIFQRLHRQEEYSGTGIGLALCKKIIERHGGRIWVESQPGQGTTFFFTVRAA